MKAASPTTGTVMMSLGSMVFRLPSLVAGEMDHQISVRHARNERIGASDAFQFIGPGDESITLSGVVLEGLHSPQAGFARLQEMQGSGRAWPLIDGQGRSKGLWIITGLGRRHEQFDRHGSPRKTGWTLNLTRASAPPASPASPKGNPAQSIRSLQT